MNTTTPGHFLPGRFGWRSRASPTITGSEVREKVVLSGAMMDRLAEVLVERQPERLARKEAIAHCIEKLPAKSRHLLELRYEDEASMDRVAEVVESTSGRGARDVVPHPKSPRGVHQEPIGQGGAVTESERQLVDMYLDGELPESDVAALLQRLESDAEAGRLPRRTLDALRRFAAIAEATRSETKGDGQSPGRNT